MDRIRPGRARHGPRGFSLIEVVVALATLAVMVAGIAVGVTGWLERARLHRAVTDVRAIRAAVETSMRTNGLVAFGSPATDLAGLCGNALLPPGVCRGSPWRGGAYGLAAANGGLAYTVTIPGVPPGAQSGLAGAFRDQGTAAPGPTTILTFQ